MYRSISTQLSPLPYPKGDFTGKTVIVTGANTGLGLEAARHFIRLNAGLVILGCRDLDKGHAAKRDIASSQRLTDEEAGRRIDVWHVQLDSFESVKAFCRRAAALERLDIVIENAGLLSHLYNTAEGYEWMTTVNVISTWLMGLLLLPVLRATKAKYYDDDADSRDGGASIPHLILVGSNAHFYTGFTAQNEPNILEALKAPKDIFNRYADTKLISLMVAREIAARMLNGGEEDKGDRKKQQVIVNVVEPGYCQSQLLREKSWAWYFEALMIVGLSTVARTSEQGARTYISAATAGWESHGIYLEDCKLSTPHAFVDSETGGKIQKKVFGEVMDVLEKIEPGISHNI